MCWIPYLTILKNSGQIVGSYPRNFSFFLWPGPISHLLSCFPFLQVLFLPLVRTGCLSSDLSYLADHNSLQILSYTKWILKSHTAAKISCVKICQVEFQGPKQRQLVPSETPKYLRPLHQSVTYYAKLGGICVGLAAGSLAKFSRATKVILHNPALVTHKSLKGEKQTRFLNER